MIYINGIKASKADIKRLCEDLKNGKNRATAHTTKNGNLAIVTEFWKGQKMKISTLIKRKSRKIAEKYGSFFAVFPEGIDKLPHCEIVLLNDKKQYIDSITQEELKAL